MVKFQVVKTLTGLRPLDETGEKYLRHIGQGELLMAEIKKERNPWHHRKLFAMLNIVLQNNETIWAPQSQIANFFGCTVENVRQHISKIYEEGELEQEATSKDFLEVQMDQSAFEDFYDKACDWILEEVIPGLERQGLEEAVAEELRQFGAPEG